MRCRECGARTPVGICIFCGADDPRGGLEQSAAITWVMRATGLGCGGLLVAFLAILVWGALRPVLKERNQYDHPSLAAARDLLTQRRYSAALDALRRAPSQSGFTADYRGLALLGMNGYRPGAGPSLERATEAFQEAIKREPELGPAYLHLAACQAMQHQDKSVALATLESLKKCAGAMFPGDGGKRDRLLYSGRQLESLIEAGAPFATLVCVEQPREADVKTFNLHLDY